MIKLISLLIAICFLQTANAQADTTGKQIFPVVNSTHQADVSLLYSIVGNSFVFFTLGVPAIDLDNGSIKSVSLRLYNKKTQSFISPWLAYYTSNKPVFFQGTYGIQLVLDNKNIVEAIVVGMQDLVLLMSVNQSSNNQATHYVDFSPLCDKYPNNFMEAVTEKPGCH